MACRDPARGKSAQDEVASVAAVPPALLLADLSVQDSIHSLAAVRSRYDRLDVLVNNTGSTQSERSTQFATFKSENALFTYELARCLLGTRVTANAISRGPSRTGYGDNLTGSATAFPKIMKKRTSVRTQTRGRLILRAYHQPTNTYWTASWPTRFPGSTKPLS